MSDMLKEFLKSYIEHLTIVYAQAYDLDEKTAYEDMLAYGAVDYIIDKYTILGHASDEAIAIRLHDIISRRKERRKFVGVA